MFNSLYIHIPFCIKKCSYCDFYSVVYQKNLVKDYIDTLCLQIKKLKYSFSTVYIGGGTPSILDYKLLKKLLKNLKKISYKVEEFTIEANPESLDKTKLNLFRDYGINRLSIGVQSFFDNKLKKLNRVHTAEDAIKAIELAYRCGFNNINIDLIFGVEDESLKNWKKELRKAVGLPIKHISTYAISYEKNTALFKKIKKKIYRPLEEEIVSDMYRFILNYLPLKGFIQYEVSNFAKKGYFCKHNLNYWNNGTYLGIGASAFSFDGRLRFQNIKDVKKYIKKIKNRESPIIFSEKLPSLRRALETASLKIRTKDGIDFRWFKKNTGFDFLNIKKDIIKNLIREGLIEYKKRKNKIVGIALTKKGFLFADTVSCNFL
ncbi:MAG: radical SAM family heme chaperone HemW [Candidatus Aenigmatarchaeota archaeon]